MDASWAEMEQCLLADAAIKQAKVFSLHTEESSAGGDQIETESAVAISLAEADAAAVKRARKALVKAVGKALVPRKWFVIDELPLDADGKVDETTLRRQLTAPKDDAAAGTSVTDKLRQIVSDILRLPISDVSASDSFIRLGGDSITAIEAMARCIDANISVRVPDIMRCESLSELASSVAPVAHDAGSKQDPVSANVRDIFHAPAAQIPSYWQCSETWSDDTTERQLDRFELSGALAEALSNASEVGAQTSTAHIAMSAIVDSFRKTFSDREALVALIYQPTQTDAPGPLPVDMSLGHHKDFTQTTRIVKDAFAFGKPYAGAISTGNVPHVELSVHCVDERQTSTDTTVHAEPMALLDVKVMVKKKDNVSFEFSSPKSFQRRDDIVRWFSECQKSLETGIPYLAQYTSLYSLSDFPLLPFSYPELDKFIESAHELGYGAIESAFPCSSVQNGILITQIRKEEVYRIDCVFEVKDHTSEGPIDLDRVEEAWKAVVNHHGALRTIFTSTRGGAVFDQIVLKSIRPDIKHLGTFSDDETAKKALEGLDRLLITNHRPAHRLTLANTTDGQALCKLEMSHALVDGMSGAILFRDFARAYAGLLPNEQGPAFGDYVAYLQDQSKESALNYWLGYLDGASPCIFPTIADTPNEAQRMKSVPVDIGDVDLQKFCKSQGVTFATLMQSVWGTVLRAYTQSDDVCFGYLASGRDIPVANMQSMVGALIHLLICRVTFGESQTFEDLLRNVQRQLGPSLDHQFTSLADIQHSLALGDRRLFNSIMSIIFPPPGTHAEAQADVEFNQLSNTTATEYDIAVICNFTPQGLRISIEYYHSLISEVQAKSLASSFTKVLHSIMNAPSSQTKEVDIFSEVDLQRVLTDYDVPATPDACVHWGIQEQIERRPQDHAIESWDGDLTYAQLGKYASRLATKLQELGVGPEVLVPLCFPKSTWATVSMLAVQMAGGAFVPLDPTAPSGRLQSILGDTKATLVLTAPSTLGKMDGLDVETLVVDESSLKQLLDPAGPVTSATKAENSAFMVFTSGSTGKPKGMVLQHNGVYCSINAYGSISNIGPGTRLFQFSAYTFDVGVYDTLATLMRGGCICIPSEYQRVNDLPGAIRAFKANWIFLTPTVAALVSPAEVPSLKLLSLGGEAIPRKVLDRWKGAAQLCGMYGPAECSICGWNTALDLSSKPTNLGRPVASGFWVVEANNPKRLVPVGCIGELLVEGPMLARGYLNVDAKDEENWLPNVDWLPVGGSRRMYRTGDLVRRNADGTYEYLGRKDTQVKLHGQRIELGEIEARLHQYVPPDMNGIVDVVKDEVTGQDSLMTFMWYTEGPHFKQEPIRLVEEVTEDMQTLIKGLDSSLGASLARYMMPSTYLVFYGKPEQTVSGKVNRRALNTLGRAATPKDRLRFSPEGNKSEPPTTSMEFKLRDLWAEVLQQTSDDIGKNDSFLRIGGDSITAIQLVKLAREHDITLTVAAIFKDPHLYQMALACVTGESEVTYEAEPFSMLPPDSIEVVKAEAREQCSLSDNEIVEDAYPCTKLQEGLMALAVKQPGSYIAKNIYRVPAHIDLDRFKAAWERTVGLCGILRTRVILSGGTTVQALIKEDAAWENTEGKSLQQYMQASQGIEMQYGSSLCRYALVQDEKKDTYFVWTIHHAAFDGWTMRIVLETLENVYRHSEAPPLMQPYSGFIKYTSGVDPEAANTYWGEQLHDAKKATFPPTERSGGSSEPKPKASRLVKKTIPFPRSTNTSITKASILRAAWAIVLARYCDTDDVTFGTTVSGRQASVPGIETMAGPMIATVPIRVKVDKKRPINGFLSDIQSQASDMVLFEQFGLQNISKVNPDAHDACDFSSLLVVQPAQVVNSGNEVNPDAVLVSGVEEQILAEEAMRNYFSYPLVLQSHLLENEIDLIFVYDTEILSEAQMTALSHQLDNVVQQLLAQDQSPLGGVSIAGDWDLQQAKERNSEVPELINSTVHELIEEQAKIRPDAPAIDAWDAQLSYAQFNGAANRLAHHLVDTCRVKPNDLVHVCFEKSAWFFIAALAINKAGAAWVPLDPSHPPTRLQQIIYKTQAKLALVSPDNMQLCHGLLPTVVEVSPKLDQTLSMMNTPSNIGPAVKVSPDSAVYVLFTSGSTGTPKGFVMNHGGVCTSQIDIGKRLGMTPDVRMLQFAAFVFDLCIGEIIAPLITGACLCVPSEHIRMNSIKEFISEHKVTWSYLTPAFARTLNPADFPSLDLLLFAGEAVGRDVFEKWFGKVRLINGWGPAETCCFSTLQEWTSKDESPLTVGRPVGGFCWIVDPEDPTRLAPTGTVGEVVIQGPTLLREYLADPIRTQASTVTQLPEWAPFRTEPAWNRFYKSGDLCAYNPDGTIEFSTRKDTQVKIRGLRVELSEVEHHVRNALTGVRQVAVDVFKTEAGANLVAYLCYNDESRTIGLSRTDSDEVFAPMTDELQRELATMVGALAVSLPRYMIPAMFVPCKYMPSITSTKLDRNTLKRMTAALSREQLGVYSLQGGKKRAPETPMESRLQLLWAEILNIPADSIGRDDSFLRIGGDSIAAIHLATTAREEGLSLTVKDVFDDPRLCAVAAKTLEMDQDGQTDAIITPFSLLDEKLRQLATGDALREQCDLAHDEFIEDAYPTTKLQEGLMALAVKQPGSYIAKYVYRIPSHVDVERFQQSWSQTIETCANLRTRLVLAGDSTIQTVVKESSSWEDTDGMDLNSFMASSQNVEMGYGSRLCRYALVKDSDGHQYFYWVIHHAVYDGWSMRLVLDTLYRLYQGTQAVPLQPYSAFIKYATAVNNDVTKDYWKAQLQDARRAAFPPPKRAAGASSDSVSKLMKRNINFPESMDSSITKASILRAAWALVLARYCDSDDVCFGTTVSGRNAAVAGLESMAGPVIATVPVRVRLDSNTTVQKFLTDVQTQSSEMVAFEQYGLQNISQLGPEAKDACDFSSLLVIQPMSHLTSVDADTEAVLVSAGSEKDLEEEGMQNYFSYPLVVQGHIFDDHVELFLVYDSDILSDSQLNAMSHQFEHVVQQLLPQDEKPLAQVSIASNWDAEKALVWNDDVPEIVDACFHDLVAAQARSQPTKPAIRAWDGEFTYAELDSAATKLAQYLVKEHNVKVEDLIHVSFEKSAWFFVSILAINKAGGIWVPLDPSHPFQRQEQVVQQTKSKLALCSPANAKVCGELVATALEVTPALHEKLSKDTQLDLSRLPQVSSRNAAYVLFTSGSTGTPKGLVMEHGSVCTSQTAIAKRLGMTSDVRMLQFAAFVFDLCIGEIVAPLIHGATLCVPSEETRMNGIKDFVRDMDVNWAYLTPAFARTLNPSDVPSLELLLLTGEAVSRDVFENWVGKLRLCTGWGPAETCVFSTLNEWYTSDESPQNVGRSVGGFCWIVDPNDPQKLAPTGTLGEVVIQGPTILREYLSDPTRTKDTTVTTLPDWAPQRESLYWNRFYKSGDLCYYNDDGTIEFSSRKDTQVKIRGLRVELGEVEHHIHAAMKGARQVAVDVFKTDAGANLVAYLCFNDEMRAPSSRTDGDLFAPMGEQLQSQITAMVGELSVALPRYMVPTLFVPCNYMPSITSTKLDRKSLRQATSELNQDDLNVYALLGGKKRAPESLMESRLQLLWADVLKMSPETIGRDDNFLRIGGDSIAAIQLVTKARDAGISLTVKDVFDDPRLSGVAAKATEVGEDALAQLSPFSLLPEGVQDLVTNDAFLTQCGESSSEAIEDAYPCTKLQEGLIALALKQPGSYIAKYVYRIPSHVDIDQFKSAWEETVRLCSNLRTRISRAGESTVQAVIKDDVYWEPSEGRDLRAVIAATKNIEMNYGSRLTRYAVAQEANGDNYFFWTIHHSVFDGWTMQLILKTLEGAYRSANIPALQPYAGFIKYTEDIDIEAATSFWKGQLQDAKRAPFPPTKSSTDTSENVSRIFKTTIPFVSTDSSITKASVLRAAWAIVLARYSDGNDVTFGATVSGRNAPVAGLETMAGPMIATVPVRIRIDEQRPILGFLNDIQTQALETVAYEQFGLQSISKLGPDAKEACDFSSLLVLQPRRGEPEEDDDSILVTASAEKFGMEEAMEGYFSYPLVLTGDMLDDSVELSLTYHANILGEHQIEAISHQFSNVVQQLLALDDTPLGEVSVSGEWDLEKAMSHNSEEFKLVDACVHDLISNRAAHYPDHEALYATEGSLTFAQLDRLSSQLATHLSGLGVGPETMVPFCFEKSMWTIVVMLGIMKAGGVFIPLDPSHPVNRRKGLIEEVNADYLIVSSSAAASCEGLTKHVIEFSPALREQLEKLTIKAHPKPTHTNAAYVLFTSGSTGKPKGLVMEHSALCSSIMGHGKAYGLNEQSRVLQFSSYVFDVSLGEILSTLVLGGTVCVPTENERLQDTANFITKGSINTAMLTPSFTRTFTPEQVPCLKTLIVGGEAPAKDTLQTWQGRVNLINGYGPAEACIYCCSYPFQSPTDNPTTIGRGPNHACWIVDPSNHNKLAPIGCIGELVVHGHALARGYINNDEVTKQSFVDSMKWLPAASADDTRRFYKTGDLVRYNADGTLNYLGRKDTQVKIRGQRLEVAEIEHTVKAVSSTVDHVAVEVIRKDGRETLVAMVSFVGQKPDSESTEPFRALDKETREAFSNLTQELEALLPPYMVPSLFLPVRNMPFVSAMKLDRKMLKAFANDLTKEQISSFSLSSKSKVSVSTGMEAKLRDLWAKVIGIPADSIGRTDSFLRVGGDSITAIQLVSMAQQEGINLSVAIIFQDPRLGPMAAAAAAAGDNVITHVEPFSMLPSSDAESIKSEVRTQCELPADTEIDDTYPATSLQDGLMALAIKQPGSYIAKFLYKLPDDVDLERFKAAWEKTLDLCGNLRLRIIRKGTKSYQALIKHDVRWEPEGQELQSFIQTASTWEMKYGTPLARYAIVHDASGSKYFAWVCHHAAYDGLTTQIVSNTLNTVYSGSEESELRPYANFIKYVEDIDDAAATDYWKKQLDQAKKASFPPAAPATGASEKANITQQFSQKIPLKRSKNTSITKATILRAAWAMVLARYCSDDDVTFGTTVSGRNAPVPGIETMPGPMITTIPVRIQVDNKRSVSKFLMDVQNQASEMIAYEQYGLQNISKVSEDAKEACDFSSLLVIQPVHSLSNEGAVVGQPNTAEGADDDLQGYFSYPLVLQCKTYDDEVELLVIYNSSVLTEMQLKTMTQQVANLIQQLVAKLEKKSDKTSSKSSSSKTSSKSSSKTSGKTSSKSGKTSSRKTAE